MKASACFTSRSPVPAGGDRVKKDRPVMVVIGNPPYKAASHGEGAWIESGTLRGSDAPLARFIPPADWGVGAHVKHLYNPYVYFWRWATWEVFDTTATDRGVVCFISVAGFLDGPGFERMREYLRSRCDAIWVIHCSPKASSPRCRQGSSRVSSSRCASCWPSATTPPQAKNRGHPVHQLTKAPGLTSSRSWRTCP